MNRLGTVRSWSCRERGSDGSLHSPPYPKRAPILLPARERDPRDPPDCTRTEHFRPGHSLRPSVRQCPSPARRQSRRRTTSEFSWNLLRPPSLATAVIPCEEPPIEM